MLYGLTGMLLGLLAGTAHAADPTAFKHQVYQAMVEHNFHGDWHSDCSRLNHRGALRQWWRLGQGQLDILETRYSDDDCLSPSGFATHHYDYQAAAPGLDAQGQHHYPLHLTTEADAAQIYYLQPQDGSLLVTGLAQDARLLLSKTGGQHD